MSPTVEAQGNLPEEAGMEGFEPSAFRTGI